MIIPYGEVMEFLDASDTFSLRLMHRSVESWIKNRSDYDFESTTYTNEAYNGTGQVTLKLKHKPISSVARLAIERDSVINIRNTSTDATTANVRVAYLSNAASTVELLVSGGANADSTSLALSTYTTMTTLVDAINAVSKGWIASIYNSDYNSILSANLLEQTLTCTSFAGVTTENEQLEMAGAPIETFLVDDEKGELYTSGGFPEGRQNVIVTYTTGYSSANMPDDLKVGILLMCQYYWEKRQQASVGISRFSLGHLSVTYANMNKDQMAGRIPGEIQAYIGHYKKRVIG